MELPNVAKLLLECPRRHKKSSNQRVRSCHRRKNREEDENPIISEQENHDGNRVCTPPPALEPKTPHSFDYAPCPKLYPKDVILPPLAAISVDAATTMQPEFNPYVSPSPAHKRTLILISEILEKVLIDRLEWMSFGNESYLFIVKD
ncbi:hypothetical protein YC2023_066833 [Brassica napus]